MEICPFDNGNYYIQFSKEELHGGAVTDMLCNLPRKPAYFEIYDSEDGALVFARTRDGTPTCFTFTDMEAVIAAAQRCPDDTLSYLAHADGRYVLIVYPWDSECPPYGLSEFSSPVQAHPDIARHIAEHGTLLLGPEAIRELRRIFVQ